MFVEKWCIMKIKIVSDSSANTQALEGVDFASVPLKIIVGDREFVDDAALDVPEMLSALREYKGKTSSACPSVAEWLSAFGDADMVFGTTITGKLSGSYNAASIAAREYMEVHPDRKVFIIDSLSTGPEVRLLVEKLRELVAAGLGFEEICEEIKGYHARTHLLFSLESLSNFVKNGRVNPALAAIAGILGIRIVGTASEIGDLQPLHKSRGEKRAIRQLYESMLEMGYKGGKVWIDHSYNPDGAEKLRDMIKASFPQCELKVGCNRGLCCYYAEEGAVLLGFET